MTVECGHVTFYPYHRSGAGKQRSTKQSVFSDIVNSADVLTFVVSTMQRDVARHLDQVRNFDDPHESLFSGRQPYFTGLNLDSAPLSPRQAFHDDRRPSLHAIPSRPVFKAPMSSHFSNPPRRYGSIGTGNPSPNFHRPIQHGAPPLHPPPHPLASVTSPDGPNLARRHTATDIRVPPGGWAGQAQSHSPFASGQSSTHWPSSPHQAPSADDQQVRDVLAQYQLGAPRQSYQPSSSQITPPLTNDTTSSTLSGESAWSLSGPKFPPRHLESAPATRRSSMASNVHSLLNPAETIEKDEDDRDRLGDERKRKRMV